MGGVQGAEPPRPTPTPAPSVYILDCICTNYTSRSQFQSLQKNHPKYFLVEPPRLCLHSLFTWYECVFQNTENCLTEYFILNALQIDGNTSLAICNV